jgi:hypothetical protein
MSLVDNPVYSKNVIEFVTVAREYCIFVEQADQPGIREFVDIAHKLLPLLYLKGSLLPELDSKYEDFNERFVSESDYEQVRNKIISKLRQFDSYQEVFDPVRQESEEPVGASISEDLSDIYQELKDFLLLYKIGTTEVMYEAVWECYQSFKNYWGQRLTNALRALHFLRYTEEDLEEGQEKEFEDELKLGDIDTSDWIISRRQEGSRNED